MGGVLEAAVLFANEAFYRAFADRDMDAMAALWAADGPVACIHPGWPALPLVEPWAASPAAALRSVAALSGGNQQKVVLGKWLSNSAVLVSVLAVCTAAALVRTYGAGQ